MSQSRFWISSHKEYEQAHEAKQKALIDNPDGVYQVRKGKDKAGIVFRLVERFKSNEAKTIVGARNSTSKKSGRKHRDNFDWIKS